jgi:hypothetical protein
MFSLYRDFPEKIPENLSINTIQSFPEMVAHDLYTKSKSYTKQWGDLILNNDFVGKSLQTILLIADDFSWDVRYTADFFKKGHHKMGTSSVIFDLASCLLKHSTISTDQLEILKVCLETLRPITVCLLRPKWLLTEDEYDKLILAIVTKKINHAKEAFKGVENSEITIDERLTTLPLSPLTEENSGHSVNPDETLPTKRKRDDESTQTDIKNYFIKTIADKLRHEKYSDLVKLIQTSSAGGTAIQGILELAHDLFFPIEMIISFLKKDKPSPCFSEEIFFLAQCILREGIDADQLGMLRQHLASLLLCVNPGLNPEHHEQLIGLIHQLYSSDEATRIPSVSSVLRELSFGISENRYPLFVEKNALMFPPVQESEDSIMPLNKKFRMGSDGSLF